MKDAVRLRDRRHREKQGRILIDGARELRRAIGAGVRLVEAFVCEPLCQSDDAQRLLAALPAMRLRGAARQRAGFREAGVRPAGGRRARRGRNAAADAAIARTSWGGSSTATPTDASRPLVAVLEGVEKPGNVGAVLRSADAAGVSAVIVADGRDRSLQSQRDPRQPGHDLHACRSAKPQAARRWRGCASGSLTILAARVDGAVPYTEVDYRGPTAIVLGSEAAGLSPVWTGDDITAVRLPMLGAADSLNVSVTAAVLFYEALRQRRCVTQSYGLTASSQSPR